MGALLQSFSSAQLVKVRAHLRRWRLFGPRLRFSERKIILTIGDLFIINVSLLLVLISQPDVVLTPDNIWQHFHWFLVWSLLWLLAGLLFNIYDLASAANALNSSWAAAGAAIFASFIYLFIPYVTPELPARRLYLFLFPVLTAVGVATWRILYAQIFVQSIFQQRALVIGAGRSARCLARAIAGYENLDLNFRISYELLGFVGNDTAVQGEVIEGIPVLGTHDDLTQLVASLNPDELIVAVTHPQTLNGRLLSAVLDCREMGVPVTTMTTLYERLTGKVAVEYAGNDLHVVLPLEQPAGYRFYMVLRQIFDLGIALLGCGLMLFLIPVIWLANRFTSPGDLFYHQERVGAGGRPFRVIKFRSMVMDAENETGAVWAQKDDPRVTPIGRILRKTRLDEVPQFWNVLKREMSLIGPRPERPQFVGQLSQEIPFYRVRHAVKPGITGWAQVQYRYGASAEDALVKLQYDLYYIKHQGLYLDFMILVKTAQVVLGLKGH